MIVGVEIKKLNTLAKIPTYGSTDAAGLDLYAAIDEPMEILPHTTRKVGTGLAFALPKNTYGAIVPRSGIATKRGLRPANTPGTIDADYRGEVIIALHNDTDDVQRIEPQERIAQMIIKEYLIANLNIVDELLETDRGESGFGDSGRF